MKKAAVVLLSALLALSMQACVSAEPETQRPAEVVGSESSQQSQESATAPEAAPETAPEETPATTPAPAEPAEPAEPEQATFLDILTVFGSFEDVTVQGTGDDVIDIPCAGSPCLIGLYHDGSRNFIVKTYDSAGDSVDLLVNTIGEYYGMKTTYEDFEDSAMLEIKADGNWTAVFKPLNEMTKAENGSTFTGDNIVYIDEAAMSKVHFTHDGSRNFIVKAVGIEDYDLLVNEIGAYDGTVIWGEPQAFFIVQADGSWSISW